MWRWCDLHNHTEPNEQSTSRWDAYAFVQACVDVGLEVVGVTDHDTIEHCEEARAAGVDVGLAVMPGVEVSTDRGHLLVLAPDSSGVDVLDGFLSRIGARPGAQVGLEELLTKATSESGRDGTPFGQSLVLIGAHVDADGSLLCSNNTLSIERQIRLARQLHALEVADDTVLDEWLAGGVKQQLRHTLLRGSDSHCSSKRHARGTWLYLPRPDTTSLRHALAVYESAVSLRPDRPARPAYAVESLTIRGGHHDGLTLEFCERTNAIIGAPNAGKSLIIDALKFVFGASCDLPEIESVTASRTKKCLPAGATVEARVRTPDGVTVLSRTVGGRAPAIPFAPIIFSQSELTRRAIAEFPAISLLDLHCGDIAQRTSAVKEAAARVGLKFLELLTLARRASELHASVSNPVDGLAATRQELARIGGSEATAKAATSAQQVRSWRQRLRSATATWAAESSTPGPPIPRPPTSVANDPDLKAFVPKDSLAEITQRFDKVVAQAVADTAKRIAQLLDNDEEKLTRHAVLLEERLSEAGFKRGTEVDSKLNELRHRCDELEAEQAELEDLDTKIDAGLVELRSLHEAAKAARHDLTAGRKATCRVVNDSMRTFFCKIDGAGTSTDLDGLIEELKTGTRLRERTRNALRDSLDRFAALEYAVRLTQSRVSAEPSSDQERVVAEALGRGHQEKLARLACLWPGDRLHLAQLTAPPTPFEELTEGLRALAIKEISFAASELPVITDQPEDAVPTRAIYESLVPTLREQRKERQFILVSHDANIVVSSDVERICVLSGGDSPPEVGTLFDPPIREAALEHLEGGTAAFRLRAERYAQLGV